jgi:hypothetical protein
MVFWLNGRKKKEEKRYRENVQVCKRGTNMSKNNTNKGHSVETLRKEGRKKGRNGKTGRIGARKSIKV